MWRFLRWVLLGLCLILVIVAGLIGLLQTGPGKRVLASQLTSLLSTEDAPLEIADIQGWVPLDMRVGSLRLADADGVWLEVDGITFDWSPSALLGGRIRIEEIGAERVAMLRPPLAGDTPEPVSDEPFRLPEMPTSLPPITVERLALPDIDLGQALLGETASFALEGSLMADDDGETLTADLDLRRTDQATAQITLDAIAGIAPPALDLTIDAEESGGILADLMARPGMKEAGLRLEGRGPLEDWKGVLRAHADDLTLLDADLGLALVEQPRLTIEGAVQPPPGTLPADIADLIGETLSVDLDLVQTRAQALDLRKVAVQTRLASLDATGAVDFERGDLSLQSLVDIPDMVPLGGLAKTPISGSAAATIDVKGTISAPEGTLALDIEQFGFDDKKADMIESIVTLTTIEPLTADRPAFDVQIEGKASNLDLPGTVLPDRDIAWSGKVNAPLEGAVTIERFAIDTAGSSLAASGQIDPALLDGAFDLTLDAPSLERLAAPYGQPVTGKALIEAAIRLSDQAKTIAVDLDAGLEELQNLPPGAAELLGERARLQAKIGLDPSQTLTVDGLTLGGAAIGLDGEAALALEQETIDGRLTLVLPDLTALETLIPDGAEGAIELQADLGGSFAAPLADLRLTSRDLVLAGEPIAALAVGLNGQNLVASPEGRLTIDVTARETPATLALDYRLADDILALNAIALEAPETRIDGALTIALEKTLIDGDLTGRIADLGALQPLIGQPLDGSIDLTASLTPDGDRQNADIVLQGQTIGGDFGSLKTLAVDARALDVMGTPGINAKASLTGFKQGTMAIDALTIDANGDSDALDFALAVAGDVAQPLEIETDGSLAFTDGLALDLERLDGTFAGETLRLVKPLAFRQTDKGMQLRDLDLRLGDASLTGDVEIDERTATGSIDLSTLPLSLSEAFGGPALSGDAGARIDISGPVTNPKVIASLDLDQVRAEEMTAGDLPIDVSLKAELDQGRLNADLTGTGLTRKPITARASLPARLQLQPFAFEMPENERLEGDIDAELLLARLADILALDDQILKGTLTADIAIGGTLAEPKVEGPVTLEGGGYENGAAGTDILNITMNANASSERIEVSKLEGRTGTKRGTIETEGWLDLDGEFPLSVTLRLDEARLVNRDDIDTRISGEIAMTGDLSQAEVAGTLTVDRAEITIPDGGDASLPEIEVSEVGGRIVNPPVEEEDAEAAEEKAFDPTLDLRILLPKKIYLRGRGLESEWEGDLRITGQASDPSIVGTLEIRQGYFDFLDKRFALEQGEITFSGATPPNPLIALEAQAEDDDFTAIIKLNGPADDPQLVLTSEPVLPEDEVLARLLFNRDLSEIGPVEAAKLALAVNRLRGGGGFDAFGEIRAVLKIDTLDVVSDDEGESRVRAGKYLNDDVYVEIEKGAGEESGRARVEVELLPNIALEADAGEDANSGVGLKWKFNY